MKLFRKLWIVFIVVLIQVVIEVCTLYFVRRHGSLGFKISLKPDVEIL